MSIIEQTIGKGITPEQTQTEVVRDHTGARHVFEVYDAGQAERDAITQREEILWPNWNADIKGKEWG